MKNILPPAFYEVLERAGICTVKEIITLSVWEIQKVTRLSVDDVYYIKNIVCNNECPKILSGLELKMCSKISLGCLSIDELLKGGLRKGTVSEIYGESGSGKTQLAIQTAACNSAGTLYICTEGVFPIKRYNQICASMNQNSKYSENMFVEHLTESNDLISCVRVRLPKLLNQNDVSLIIIDSVAAPFRCEYQNYIQRAEELKELAILLYKAAVDYKLAVICINQVTASFGNNDSVLPTLGLVWSNMVTNRFQVKKTCNVYNSTNKREFSIVYAPDLPSNKTEFIITSNGVENVTTK